MNLHRCKFQTISYVYSGEIKQRDGSYFIDVPESEVSLSTLDEDTVYRVALFEAKVPEAGDNGQKSNGSSTEPSPPVEVGEQRTVDIEDIGEQGDGIARVERGYVVIIPDTELGERVTVEITDVRENLGFAEVIEREDYYE